MELELSDIINEASVDVCDAAPTTLAEHDKRFHPNGWKQGDSCSYREALAAKDNADKLQTGGAGGQQVAQKDIDDLLQSARDIEDFQDAINKVGANSFVGMELQKEMAAKQSLYSSLLQKVNGTASPSGQATQPAQSASGTSAAQSTKQKLSAQLTANAASGMPQAVISGLASLGDMYDSGTISPQVYQSASAVAEEIVRGMYSKNARGPGGKISNFHPQGKIIPNAVKNALYSAFNNSGYEMKMAGTAATGYTCVIRKKRASQPQANSSAPTASTATPASSQASANVTSNGAATIPSSSSSQQQQTPPQPAAQQPQPQQATSYQGSINLSKNNLSSLPQQPQNVTGDFNCSVNALTSLQGAPQSVGGRFFCYDNQLTSLQGAPQSVGGAFDCAANWLHSLQGAPQAVGGYFNCSNNQLTSLQGAPQSVGGDFSCNSNKLTSLDGAPVKVGGRCSFFYNQGLTAKQIKDYEDFLKNPDPSHVDATGHYSEKAIPKAQQGGQPAKQSSQAPSPSSVVPSTSSSTTQSAQQTSTQTATSNQSTSNPSPATFSAMTNAVNSIFGSGISAKSINARSPNSAMVIASGAPISAQQISSMKTALGAGWAVSAAGNKMFVIPPAKLAGSSSGGGTKQTGTYPAAPANVKHAGLIALQKMMAKYPKSSAVYQNALNKLYANGIS